MHTPYKSKSGSAYFPTQILKAQLGPPIAEGFTAAAWQHFVAPRRGVLFYLVLGGHVVLSRSFPEIRKTSRALPRLPKVSEAQYQLL
jgi:hypothetical protein